MVMAQEYRRFAVGFIDLAKQQEDMAEKTRHLIVAEAWLDLTERTTQSRDKTGEARELIERPLIAARVLRYRHDD